jgi:hypothetical protein
MANEKKNLKVLRAIRIEGEHIEVGTVISKTAFESRGDWYDLCEMTPPRLEETDEPLGVPGKAKAAMPAVTKE